MTKGDTTRGAGTFDFRAGNIAKAQARTNYPCKHLFAIERATDEITQVQRANFLALDAGLNECGRCGLYREGFDRCRDVLTERGGAHSSYVDVAHYLYPLTSSLRNSVLRILP